MDCIEDILGSYQMNIIDFVLILFQVNCFYQIFYRADFESYPREFNLEEIQ